MKKIKRMKSPKSLFTHQEQKDTQKNFVTYVCLMALLFYSFQVASGFHPKDLTFFQTNETKLIEHAFGDFRSEYPKD